MYHVYSTQGSSALPPPHFFKVHGALRSQLPVRHLPFFQVVSSHSNPSSRPSSSCHPPSHLDLLHQSLVSFNKNQKQSDTGIILPVLSATRATQGLLPLFFSNHQFYSRPISYPPSNFFRRFRCPHFSINSRFSSLVGVFPSAPRPRANFFFFSRNPPTNHLIRQTIRPGISYLVPRDSRNDFAESCLFSRSARELFPNLLF
ncbi:uncharacterized protein F4817DRAFT_37673 [Daldinia loculata]|uniref:uncharacterized protein n=1 Tax=Daldinia loculata TaxID=103429 RepID=UPI0020C2DABF|nr:uncharacterized protein F4817DRAFT_37673 [Daldinia loculata]KAI1649444.1 hypothetical protein F4817DRAFT_37673 [Daldinia loculata]